MRKQVPNLLAALIAALLVVPTTYALLRGYDVLFKTEANPATVIFSAKIAMFWRLAVSAYIAPMVGFGVYFGARKNLPRTMELLYVCALIAAGTITFQGLVMP